MDEDIEIATIKKRIKDKLREDHEANGTSPITLIKEEEDDKLPASRITIVLNDIKEESPKPITPPQDFTIGEYNV